MGQYNVFGFNFYRKKCLSELLYIKALLWQIKTVLLISCHIN